MCERSLYSPIYTQQYTYQSHHSTLMKLQTTPSKLTSNPKATTLSAYALITYTNKPTASKYAYYSYPSIHIEFCAQFGTSTHVASYYYRNHGRWEHTAQFGAQKVCRNFVIICMQLST